MKRLHLRRSSRASAEGAAPQAHGKGVLHILARTLKLSVELFKPPVLYRTVLCCMIYFCSMFV